MTTRLCATGLIRHPRTTPIRSDRCRPRNGRIGGTPALTTGYPLSTAPEIEPPLATGVKVEKTQRQPALAVVQRFDAADQLIVIHKALGQADGTPGPHPDPRPQRQTRPQHHRIQQIPLAADIGRHTTVVEWTGKGRDKIHMAVAATLEEAAPGDLYHHLHFGWVGLSIFKCCHILSIAEFHFRSCYVVDFARQDLINRFTV